MTTPLLEKAFELHDDSNSPAHDIVEGAIYEVAKTNTHISFATLLPIKHRDAPGGGSVEGGWDWDEITDPRVVKV
jgi:hypothetical protein